MSLSGNPDTNLRDFGAALTEAARNMKQVRHLQWVMETFDARCEKSMFTALENYNWLVTALRETLKREP